MSESPQSMKDYRLISERFISIQNITFEIRTYLLIHLGAVGGNVAETMKR